MIDGFACEGIIQFFFETTEDNNVFNIYILDEANRVEIYSHCEGSKEELVKMSAVFTLHLMIALLMAQALSTSICHSFIKS